MSNKYNADDLCGGPANGQGWFDPGFMHNVIVSQLKPETIYFYRVGDNQGGYSKEFYFNAPKLIGPDVPLVLSVIGL